MIALPIISMVCCLTYIIYVVSKFGVPVSLSETYYLLDNKWDWLFSAWCVLTAGPLGFYWFTIAPNNLKWLPIVTAICLMLVGVACRYKSIDKPVDLAGEDDIDMGSFTKLSFKEFVKSLRGKFSWGNLTQFGLARPIHYVCSLVAVGLSTTYLCMVNKYAILSTCLLYAIFIFIGTRLKGVYNKHYSVDCDNSCWVFFMEVICFINLFIFIWF